MFGRRRFFDSDRRWTSPDKIKHLVLFYLSCAALTPFLGLGNAMFVALLLAITVELAQWDGQTGLYVFERSQTPGGRDQYVSVDDRDGYGFGLIDLVAGVVGILGWALTLAVGRALT